MVVLQSLRLLPYGKTAVLLVWCVSQGIINQRAGLSILAGADAGARDSTGMGCMPERTVSGI